MPDTGLHQVRRWAPELALGVMALIAFLFFLGSMDLWGKREQRAAAETIDTVHEGHWLVAQIQGRPRLEKPPLPRWTVASLMILTGREDEWIVRLPSALAALGMVALTYLLGCRLGGRALGLTAGILFCSFPFVVSELRQAGNDGLLAAFTTLALYAAWRRLHGGPPTEEGEPAPIPAEPTGHRGWGILVYFALGLSFLTKGPIGIVLFLLTVVPYLILMRRVRPGLRALADPLGLLLFLGLAASWPVPVMLSDPNAVRIWLLEMGQKAGTAGVQHHRDHEILALDWFGMVAPWCVVGAIAVVGPVLRRGRGLAKPLWFAWFWTMLTLFMFCFWTVAKPNYYLPCMPGAALIIAAGWLSLCRNARTGSEAIRGHSRRVLQGHWVVLMVALAVAPVVVSRVAPMYLWLTIGFALVGGVAVVMSAWSWRHRYDVAACGCLAAVISVMTLIAYGVVIPAENASRSHRALARTLEDVLPPEASTVMFFHELDEGLWFYLRDRRLEPIPGSNPSYNDGFDMLQQYKQNALSLNPAVRSEQQKRVLLDWITQAHRKTPYVLIRASRYDVFAPDLTGLVEVVYRERDVKRNDLVLLRTLTVPGPAASTADADDPERTIR